MENTLKVLYDQIKSYPDFPSEGVLFKDILPLLITSPYRKLLVSVLAESIPHDVTCIVAPESRGFLLGILVADYLSLRFVPIRKKGKLPGDVHTVTYKTEYSTDTLQVQKDTLTNAKCWFIDDIYATGGTYSAIEELVQMDGGQLIGGTVLLKVLDNELPQNIKELFKNIKE